MQRAETAARSVSRRGELLEGRLQQMCMHCIHTHTHAAMLICLCPLSASECGMQSRSCHCCPPAPLPTLPDDRQPTDRCSACTASVSVSVSGQQLLFSNGRQGNKSFAHSTLPAPVPLSLPFPRHSCPLLTTN